MQHFLGLPGPRGAPVSLLPIPYERTTSYGKGTRDGPAAMLEASHQVENLDLETGVVINEEIYTAPPWQDDADLAPEQALSDLKDHFGVFVQGTFPLAVGGEHTITLPFVEALRDHPEVDADLSNLVVVHFDAHADLREEYGGSRYSHACVLRRVNELGVRIVSRGVRELSVAELDVCNQSESITMSRDPADFRSALTRMIRPSDRLHLTVDIDVLDAPLVPATGTPVPGGLSLKDLLSDIEAVFHSGPVVSADVTEVASRSGDILTEFTSAIVVRSIVARALLQHHSSSR